MMAKKAGRILIAAGVAVAVVIAAVGLSLAQRDEQSRVVIKPGTHVPEVRAMLSDLRVEKPRRHKNMVVFPLRWAGRQAGGDWETMDDSIASGRLKISEKDNASVPEVVIENTGGKSVLLMSGEIVKGGKQTRVIKADTVIETRQTVTVPVFCVERRRWHGGKKFSLSPNIAPSSIRNEMSRGADQGAVWGSVRKAQEAAGAEAPTESLDEVLDSDKVKQMYEEVHKSMGKFSPKDTIGIAVADTRTGRVIALELFGRRDLFEALQDKLIEGYAMDLVGVSERAEKIAPKDVTAKDVEAFIRRALDGTSRYEDTPGSGRGIDLTAGSIKGKGVALGDSLIHISIQDQRPDVTPARPVVRD